MVFFWEQLMAFNYLYSSIVKLFYFFSPPRCLQAQRPILYLIKLHWNVAMPKLHNPSMKIISSGNAEMTKRVLTAHWQKLLIVDISKSIKAEEYRRVIKIFNNKAIVCLETIFRYFYNFTDATLVKIETLLSYFNPSIINFNCNNALIIVVEELQIHKESNWKTLIIKH